MYGTKYRIKKLLGLKCNFICILNSIHGQRLLCFVNVNFNPYFYYLRVQEIK
jgi:hypothetical protein